jgi:signal transduction histidine kinase/DNA-binding response OmpR family regulator
MKSGVGSNGSGKAADTRQNEEELRREILGIVSAALTLVSGLAATATLPDLYYGRNRFPIYFSLLITGGLALACRHRRPRLAELALVIGSTLSLSGGLWLMPQNPAMPFFAVLIAVAAAAINPMLGLAATVLCTVPLFLLAPSTGLRAEALLLLWMAAGLQWVSSRALRTALEWAWSSQERAARLLAELRVRQGELNQTLAALTEATSRLQRTGYELALARMRAEEARRLKEQLATHISHELRTPLSLILGFSEVMHLSPEAYGDMQWPSALRADVRRIYESSRQLLDLVNDIIDLARVDRLQLPIRKEPSDLDQVIREAVETVAGIARTRDLDIRMDIPAALPLLNFDRTRIRQVLLNLLNNAVRFTDSGEVAVSVSSDGREVTVTVSDTGVGIAPDKLARVFDEFYQVDVSADRPRGGSGLGLAISKRFVEMHGGRIWAESRPGKGSRFHFTLPLSAEASVGGLYEGRAPRPQPGRYEPCVVVLDNDPLVGTLLSRYLPGFRFLQAQDLGSVPGLLAEWHPQAVIVNARPAADGWDQIRQAAAVLPSKTPLLFCSLPSHSRLAVEIGARACVSKPITRELLLAALAEFPGASDVLIVDDDRGFVQLVVRLLESSGTSYAVRWAYDGREALSRIQERTPDVILLDLVMPGMDGLQLLGTLKADAALSQIPVVVVTATGYAHLDRNQEGDVLGLWRRQGLQTTEVIRYLQAMLEASEGGFPHDSVPARSAGDRG